ncbi:MAG TPA: tRNA (adenosine(37)-N6)-threonylcarbamoyltransferase complex dimerization subunit type 1 TsaB [Bacteroidales bacterium]|nr:tRNA (adenosine(37)-N6)-threonylcarbamoyltransferase complex dimerization subunit type 1 TsaB [Bacteroidales bacterium]
MATVLCLDTATAVCSVALGRDGVLWQMKESHLPNAHSSLIISFIEEVVATAGIRLPTVDAIAVSRGPGSYTGLRIGVSTAKGLCYALERPLIAVGSLQALAWGMRDYILQQGISSRDLLFCPMIDARRMEVYTALYDMDNQETREIRAEIITENSFSEHLKDHKVVFFGDGAAKCRPVLEKHPNAVFRETFLSSAAHLVPLAEDHFRTSQFVDVAYFEPFYLKEFIPGIPRVKGLRE